MDEVVELLEAITRMQAEVIGELFRLLSQHVSSEELDGLAANKRLNEAAGLKADVGRLKEARGYV